MTPLESLIESLVVIDAETSGVNPFRHQLLSVALVPLNGSPPTTVFVKPGAITWQKTALEIFEKYKAEWEARALDPVSACDSIDKYLQESVRSLPAIAVGHNIAFDIGFLRKLADQANREQLANLSHRSIDTHSLLYALYLAGQIPREATTSDGAFAYFGVSPSPHNRHTALGDALATRSLFLRLLESMSETKASVLRTVALRTNP